MRLQPQRLPALVLGLPGLAAAAAQRLLRLLPRHMEPIKHSAQCSGDGFDDPGSVGSARVQEHDPERRRHTTQRVCAPNQDTR